MATTALRRTAWVHSSDCHHLCLVAMDLERRPSLAKNCWRDFPTMVAQFLQGDVSQQVSHALGRLSPDSLESVVQLLQTIELRDVDDLDSMACTIFRRAVSEQHNPEVYARLVERMWKCCSIPAAKLGAKRMFFGRSFMNTCQEHVSADELTSNTRDVDANAPIVEARRHDPQLRCNVTFTEMCQAYRGYEWTRLVDHWHSLRGAREDTSTSRRAGNSQRRSGGFHRRTHANWERGRDPSESLGRSHNMRSSRGNVPDARETKSEDTERKTHLLGCVKLIAYLFVRRRLTFQAITRVADDLLATSDSSVCPTGERVEGACRLLDVACQELDGDLNEVEQIIARIRVLSKCGRYPALVNFCMENVIIEYGCNTRNESLSSSDSGM